MRVTVTELKRMIAESVAKHMKEGAPTASAVPLRGRMPAPVPGPTGEMQTGGVGGKPVGMNKEASLRSMVREVIEEMMDNEKVNEEMYEAEKLKEAVRKMVRAELKRSGR
jgi:hypothetical protein